LETTAVADVIAKIEYQDNNPLEHGVCSDVLIKTEERRSDVDLQGLSDGSSAANNNKRTKSKIKKKHECEMCGKNFSNTEPDTGFENRYC